MLRKIIFRPFTFIVILLVLVEALVSVLPQQVFGMIIDTISLDEAVVSKYTIYPIVSIISQYSSYSLLTQLFILYLILSLFSLFMSIIRGYSVTYNGEKILLNIREKLFSSLIRSNYSYLNNLRSGETTLRMLSDVENVRGLVIGPINGLLIDLITVFFIAFICFRISTSLSLLMLIPVPLVILNSFILGNKQIQISTRLREQLSHLTSITLGRIKGFLLLKLFAQEAKEEEQYSLLLKSYFSQAIKSLKVANAVFPLTSGIQIVVSITLLYLGILRVQEQVLSVGELLIFIQYLGRFYSPFVNISRFYNSVAMSIVSYKKLSKAFQETRENRDFASDESSMRADTLDIAEPVAIAFDAVSFRYDAGDKSPDILESMSFKLMHQEKVALVGESGKGKTTVLNLIVKLLTPQKGNIKLYGKDLHEYNTTFLRSRIGYLSQNSIMYNIPLIENLRYGVPHASEAEVIRALNQVNMQQYTSPKLLYATMGESGELLSGGEKQRIAIARLILCDPDIILLDEPIANLDIDNAKCVMDLIFEVFAKKTILITSHQELALSYSTRTIVIE